MYLLAFILFYGCKMFIYLAINTTWSQFLLITYIVFLTKMQKRQTLWNGFTLIGKRYHNFWRPLSDSRYIADTCNRKGGAKCHDMITVWYYLWPLNCRLSFGFALIQAGHLTIYLSVEDLNKTPPCNPNPPDVVVISRIVSHLRSEYWPLNAIACFSGISENSFFDVFRLIMNEKYLFQKS